MVKKQSERTFEKRENVRGGTGVLDFAHCLTSEEACGKMNMCAVITFEPGAFLGYHSHNPEAEMYFILEGEFTVSDNGEEKILYPGDVMFTGNGDSHSATNKTDKPAKMLAVIVK